MRSKPGAHFFTVFNSHHGKEAAELSNKCVKSVNSRSMALAAPRSRKTGRLSWFCDNQSAYLANYGLWTACWESRHAMSRHYKRPLRQHCIDKSPDKESLGQYHVNDRSGSLTRCSMSGDEQICLAFSPVKDLFCLHPVDFDTVCWDSSPFYLPPSVGQQTNHIAFEFDPNWINEFDKGTSYWNGGAGALACIMQAAMGQLQWARRLWLIDYRIRQRSQAIYTEDGRHIFEGLRCKLFEVMEYEDGWKEVDDFDNSLCLEEDISDYPPTGSRLSIFRFLKAMRESLDSSVIRNTAPGTTNRDADAPGAHQHKFDIGVLACEFN